MYSFIGINNMDWKDLKEWIAMCIGINVLLFISMANIVFWVWLAYYFGIAK
jgi:hypothetical protein